MSRVVTVHFCFFLLHPDLPMNLFLIAEDPQEIAEAHCDSHVVKMIIETAQILYCAWWCTGRDKMEETQDPPPYRVTHKNHPTARWIRADSHHYQFACRLGLALCKEYTSRFEGRVHKTQLHLERLMRLGSPPVDEDCRDLATFDKVATCGLPEKIGFFPCAIDDETFEKVKVCRPELDAIETYRNYYRSKLDTMKRPMKWKRPNRPAWMSFDDEEPGQKRVRVA